jgi:hypothetical protein
MNVIDQLRAGQAVFEWAPVCSTHQGYKLTFAVTRDAIKFIVDVTCPGGTEPAPRLVRRMVNALETQEAADFLFCMMLTPKMEDLIFQQATVRLAPITRIDGNICAVSTDVRHSELVDKAIGDKDDGGLISTVGKSWVLSNFLFDPRHLRYGARTACNYGWVNPSDGHLAVTPGLHAWQSPGYQHDDSHKDPSQTLRLVYGAAVLTEPSGTTRVIRMREVLTSSELAPLVSHEGPLKYLRQAGVPAPPDPFGGVLLSDEDGLAMLPVGIYNAPEFIYSSPQVV